MNHLIRWESVTDMPSSDNGFEWVFFATRKTQRNKGAGGVPRSTAGLSWKMLSLELPKIGPKVEDVYLWGGSGGPPPENFSFFPFKWCTAWLCDRFGQKPCFSFLPVSPLIMVRFEKFKNWIWVSEMGHKRECTKKDLICVRLTRMTLANCVSLGMSGVSFTIQHGKLKKKNNSFN